jgi:hypothetical protein
MRRLETCSLLSLHERCRPKSDQEDINGAEDQKELADPLQDRGIWGILGRHGGEGGSGKSERQKRAIMKAISTTP